MRLNSRRFPPVTAVFLILESATMSDDLFAARLNNYSEEGELSAFNLACVSEALDTIKRLADENTGGETVEQRIGEYKSWDPDIYKVDKDTEDGFVARLKESGRRIVLLSEEAGRVEINPDVPGDVLYAVADPFDGSFLFKHGLPDFWYSSLSFFDSDFNPICCAVGDGVQRNISFANESGAFLAHLDGDRLVHKVRLTREYRKLMGRKERTDLEGSAIESYALKPRKFLMPLVDKWRNLLLPFKFFLPNGGPYGFSDVAEGKMDVYFAVRQPYVDVFSGIMIALKGETIVTDFDGNPVRPGGDVETLWDVLCTTNQALHDKMLQAIADCRAELPRT